MPDKDRERFYLTQFLSTCPELEGLEHFESDPPDFYLNASDSTLGLEITVFYLPPPLGAQPHQAIESLQENAVKQARAQYRASGGPALYCTITWRDASRLSKARAFGLAPEIAACVAKVRPPRSLDEGYLVIEDETLPPEIVSIRLLASVDGEDELWYGGTGGWVAPVGSDLIQAAINAKAVRYSGYAAKHQRTWLVIVEDPFSKGASSEATRAALSALYSGPFERVYWLWPHGPKAHRLAIKTP